MTAADTEQRTLVTERPAARSPWRPLLAFGTGIAIEIAGDALEVAVVRLSPSGPHTVQRATIDRFRERPAAEWSEVFREIVRGHESPGVAVLLPRRDVIVRYVPFPGVSRSELGGALALRLRTLHPFPEDDVAWCWAPVANGALVGLTRLATVGKYESLFAEAGIPVASFTFSASALHSALRIYGQPALPLLGIDQTGTATYEAYGENAAGAIFSSEFTGVPQRALTAAVAELRLPSDFEASELIPGADRPALHAAAMANASFVLAQPANFLPPERRAGRSRVWLIPTVILSALLVAAVIAIFAFGPWSQKRYLETLHQEIDKIDPQARLAGALDRKAAQAAANIQMLDGFRRLSKDDFEVLNELTRVLPPPTWTSVVEIYPDNVIIGGETDQAAPLLKILDTSPLFRNAEFTSSVSRTIDKNELFRIRIQRRTPAVVAIR